MDSLHTVKKNSKKATKDTPNQAYVLGIIAIIVCGLLLFANFGTLKDAAVTLSYSGPAEIKEIADKSGMSLHGKAVFYSADPALLDANSLSETCDLPEYDVLFGCYLPDENKMYLLDVPEEYKSALYATAAHEMLHAAWYSELSTVEKEDLETELTHYVETSKDDTELNESFSAYDSAEEGYIVEVHAIVGSEAVTIPNRLANHYKIYLSERQESVSHNKLFNNLIDDKIEALNTEVDALNAVNAEIGDFKVAHLDNIEYQMNLAYYWGDYTSYNLNVDAYNHNLAIYNQKIDSYNARLATYNEDYYRFMNVYETLFPTETAPVKTIES